MKAGQPAPPSAVHWITSRLEDRGFETWTVGGAVRDAILGRPSGDWDLATRATPNEVRRIFKRTVPIGIEHGTVGILKGGVLYEITTFRRDVETDGRHAVVRFSDSIDEDLARRDFTINAIAWHALRRELRDPFDGAGDLNRGLLRTVGTAEERFQEDYLRILRAFRFAGRFGLRVDEELFSAAQTFSDRLATLSAERVREELLKVLDADPDPTVALEAYRTSGALAVLYPEWARRMSDPDGSTWWDDGLRVMGHLPPGRPSLRLASRLRGVPAADTAALLVRLRFSNRMADRVARIAAARALPDGGESDAAVRLWLSREGPEMLAPSARLELASARAARAGPSPDEVVDRWRRARAALRARPPLSVGDLRIDGRRLKGLGLRPGPLFGEILEVLLGEVLESPERNEPDYLDRRALEVASEEGEASPRE